MGAVKIYLHTFLNFVFNRGIFKPNFTTVLTTVIVPQNLSLSWWGNRRVSAAGGIEALILCFYRHSSFTFVPAPRKH